MYVHLLPPNPEEVVAVLKPNPELGVEKGLANKFAPEFVPNPPNPAVDVVCAPNAGLLLANNPPCK